MNEGIIYKVKIDKGLHYYIRLEKTEKIGDTEYNIFIGEPNGSDTNVKLVPVEAGYTFEKDLTSFLGKKLEFCIDFVKEESKDEKENTAKEKIILKSVEYEE